jgi:hypothetical protein
MSKFNKGQSGNPAGRPTGLTAATQIRKEIESALPGILATVIRQASEGDLQAAKLLLDKICPNLRPQALPVNIPIGISLPDTGNHVVNATLNGIIPPDIGSMLIRALAEQGKLIELQDMAERLQRLEKLLETRS